MRTGKLAKWAAVAFFSAAMICANTFVALAGTKPINKVSIQVTSKLEPGQELPEIKVGDSSAGEREVSVRAGNSQYSLTAAEWIDTAKDGVQIASELRMSVTLEPEDVSEYYFLASYKASSVSVSGGTFVSARRDGDALVVTLRVRGVKGQYDSPEDAFWNEKNLGEARWKESKFSSGYYEVELLRDGKKVHKIDKTSAKNYNFYPYMTKSGEYTFKVRSIPGTELQKKSGRNSEWIESGEITITDRYVSDGKGQQNSSSKASQGTDKKVGWFQDEKIWYYRYPDGNLARGGWQTINGKWYYFHMDGRMLAGWQQVNGDYYYLLDDGQMAVGWMMIDGKWYYFNPATEDKVRPEGAMTEPGWKTIGPYYYYFNADGSLYTGWLYDQGHWYYLNTVDNSLQGAMFVGWIKRDEKTYYTNSNGEMAEGWWQIDGNWYYFYPGSGEMAYNTYVDGFYVDSYGIWNQ